MNTTDLKIHEITSLEDEAYDSWLDLYQVAFPLDEQMKVSAINRVLRQKVCGKATDDYLLTVQGEKGEHVAMAYYEVMEVESASGEGDRVGVLWYLAVSPEKRSGGIGSILYSTICQQAFETGCRLVAMEVEREDIAAQHSEADARNAVRRLTFYCTRHGAKIMTGIEYIQSVGWQKPVPMHLLIQENPAFPALKPDEAFSFLKLVFKRALRQVGTVGLSNSVPVPLT